MRYRPEIDGLRAVAVVPVVLFHGGFQAFAGGFVGVDVFFVISGYLITSIIAQDLGNGRFSLIGFYERRARRILPALFLVSLSCFVLAWYFMPPKAMKEFSHSLAAVAAFGSNILFWRQSGYFDTAGELKPLLHTWSLAVEEQYYMLFPLLLALAWRFGKQRLALLLAILGAISLTLSQWGTTHRPAAAFYLLPTRSWELFLGGLLALYLSDSRRQTPTSGPVAQSASLLGLLCIGWSVVAFDRTTSFPGLNALAPTLGTALVILFATPSTITGTVLGSRPFVSIGLVSYSVYLWHQPLFAFARLRSLSGLSPLSSLLAGGLAVGLAYLTWRWVESPFRDRSRTSRQTVFVLAGTGTLALCLLGMAGHFKGGFPSRFPDLARVQAAFAGMLGRTGPSLDCYERPGKASRDQLCRFQSATDGIAFVAVGDSHMFTLHEGFQLAASEEGLSGAWISGEACLPLLGVYVVRDGGGDMECASLNQRVFDYVKANRVPRVYLVARWGLYADGGKFLSGQPDPRGELTSERSRELLAIGLANTIAAFAAVGTRVTIVLQAPEQARDPEAAYARAVTYRRGARPDVLRVMSTDKREHERKQAFVRTLIDEYRREGLADVLSLDGALCDATRCLIGVDGTSYYSDDNHLSPDGARLTGRVIAEFMAVHSPLSN